MPPQLALFLTISFSGFLLWRDTRKTPSVSVALWLPVIWIFLLGSRFVSQWLGILGLPFGTGTSLEDGSPLDAAVFLVLIAAGSAVLMRRKFSPATFAAANVCLTVFLVYCCLSIVWSDFPMVAFKRWIKTLGQPIMVLIILTDPNREEAFRRVLKRSAYLLLPLSILFIKYYPEYGRYFDSWTGIPSNRGVALSKNELGSVCLMFGLFFFWSLLTVRRLQDRQRRREEIAMSLGFLWMVSWLLWVADSATSLACMVIGIATISLLSTPIVSKRYFGTYVITGAIVAFIAESAFGIYELILTALGRDPTLTTRTEMWKDLVSVPINPVLGAGFESFWLGERLAIIWRIWDFGPNQAHNGYLETYLNLGWLGVLILVALLVVTFRKGQAEVLRDFDFGRWRLGVLFAVLAYNYTESAFKGLHLMWTMFFIISIDYVTQTRTRHEVASAVRPMATRQRMTRPAVAYRGSTPSPRVTNPVLNRSWRRPVDPSRRSTLGVKRHR